MEPVHDLESEQGVPTRWSGTCRLYWFLMSVREDTQQMSRAAEKYRDHNMLVRTAVRTVEKKREKRAEKKRAA